MYKSTDKYKDHILFTSNGIQDKRYNSVSHNNLFANIANILLQTIGVVIIIFVLYMIVF